MAGQQNSKIGYQAVGTSIQLPRDYCVAELPDWRAVHFSLILPMPRLKVSDFGPGWKLGRFNGIKRISSAVWDEDADKYVAPEMCLPDPVPDSLEDLDGTTKKEFFDHTPRAFYESAKQRFKEPLRSSVAGIISDGPAITGERRYEHYLAGRPERITRALKFPFKNDCSQCLGDNNYEFVKKDQWDHVDHAVDMKPCEVLLPQYSEIGGKVQLLCAEYVDYEEPCHKEEDHPCSGQNSSTVLVLHVVAENCSSAQLDDISQSLRRPRNTVHVEGEGQRVALLSRFCDHAFSVLPLPADASLKMERGGYISATGECFEQRSTSMRPFTVVCAVPAKKIDTRPRLIEKFESSWSEADMWAWRLSTGADKYYEGLPLLDEVHLSKTKTASYNYWTIHNSGDGMAVVRTAEPSPEDNKLWMLAGTRFVDLALLVRRSGRYLSELSERLRRIRFVGDEVEKILLSQEIDEKDVAEANENLSASLSRFQDLQRDLIEFRDRLWFEHVAGRDVDTIVLNALQTSTGVKHQFDDVSREIELRKDVYSTQYQALKILAQERLEKQDQARQKQLDNSTQFLGFAAVVLAVPPILETVPFAEDSWQPFGYSVLIIVVLTLVLIWYWRRNHKS